MEVIRLWHDTVRRRPLAVTVGFFDGVHRGHRFLIGTLADRAMERGLATAVVTFDRHPREVVSTGYRPMMLSTLGEKLALLGQTGVECCVVLPFDEVTAGLSARQFMQEVLRDRLGAELLVTGYDNRFGHNRSEGFADYVRYGRELGIEVVQADPMVDGGVAVSSSVVRSLLGEGQVQMAARCLGYPYTVEGSVVGGEHIGTGLGFPTANIVPCSAHKLIPAPGVYAVRVRIDGETELRPAMMNIGTRPTFGGSRTTIEVHIMGFEGNIYGRTIGVAFEARLRGERKFDSPALLAAQLGKDRAAAARLLGAEP